jgi:transcriptional regulator with XRE-family HTH domain
MRSLRGDMSQEKAMEKLGMNQNAISRLENPYYGKATLTTLKRIAAAYDVGLLVEFVPFSRLVNHISGTPSTDPGLSPSTMNVPNFDDELQQGMFEETQPQSSARIQLSEIYSKSTPTGTAKVSGSEPTKPAEGTQLDVSVPSISGDATCNTQTISIPPQRYTVEARSFRHAKTETVKGKKWSGTGRRLGGRRNTSIPFKRSPERFTYAR